MSKSFMNVHRKHRYTATEFMKNSKLWKCMWKREYIHVWLYLINMPYNLTLYKPTTLIHLDCSCSSWMQQDQSMCLKKGNKQREKLQAREEEKKEGDSREKMGEEVQPSTDGGCLVAKATSNRQNNGNMALFSELSSNVTFFSPPFLSQVLFLAFSVLNLTALRYVWLTCECCTDKCP